jgi:hypothetical protein
MGEHFSRKDDCSHRVRHRCDARGRGLVGRLAQARAAADALAGRWDLVVPRGTQTPPSSLEVEPGISSEIRVRDVHATWGGFPLSLPAAHVRRTPRS